MIIFIQFQVLLLAKVQVHERLLLPSAADLEPDGREHRHARDHDRLEVAPAPVAAGRLLAAQHLPCVVAREVFNSLVSHLICVSVLQFAAQPRKMYHIISVCISIFNFRVFLMGFKWGMRR